MMIQPVAPSFELRQLRCFVAAAEELHFGRAAARVHMTQPPLSRQIQLLERAVGVKLLDRDNRLVKLTPAGQTFLSEAQRILRLAERATLTIRGTADEFDTIRLGFTASSGYSCLPRLVSLCAAQLPTLNFSLKEMVTTDQTAALLAGNIDVGLVRPPVTRTEFRRVRVISEPLVAALPSGDARLQYRPLRLSDFHEKPVIMYSQEGARYFHDMLISLFDSHSVTPVYVQYLSQIHSILAMVRLGIGAALVPEAATSLHFDGVHFRPVSVDIPHPAELYMTWRAENENSGIRALLDVVRKAFVPVNVTALSGG